MISTNKSVKMEDQKLSVAECGAGMDRLAAKSGERLLIREGKSEFC